jgi:dUTP pyrophosphatase
MSILQIKKLHPQARIPQRATAASAGLDLYAAVATIIPPAQVTTQGCVNIGRGLVATGIAMSFPPGLVARIGSRSGWSITANIEVGAGWIDSDYRGEIQVELKNLSAEAFAISVGQRIAQLFILPLVSLPILQTDSLPSSERGNGGFGSTGN